MSSGDPWVPKERKQPSRSWSHSGWNYRQSSHWLQEQGSKGCREQSQGKKRLQELSRHGKEGYAPSPHGGETTQPRRVRATALGAGIAAPPAEPCTTLHLSAQVLRWPQPGSPHQRPKTPHPRWSRDRNWCPVRASPTVFVPILSTYGVIY